MLSSKRVTRQCTIAATLLAGGLLGPAAAEARIKVTVLGWTTQARSLTPQAANNKTITTCFDMDNGQRSPKLIYKGTGIPKYTKVGVGLWGGPRSAGLTTQPTDAAVIRGSFKWPVGENRSLTRRYGFSFKKGPVPFGPKQINGVWYAKIIVKKRVVARAKITVAC